MIKCKFCKRSFYDKRKNYSICSEDFSKCLVVLDGKIIKCKSFSLDLSDFVKWFISLIFQF